MKASACIPVVCAVALAGCASSPRLPQSYETRSHPKVVVENGRLSIGPDPLFFGPKEKGEITWELPKRSPYRFPPDGVVIEGRLVSPAPYSVDPNTPRESVRGELTIDPNQVDIVCPRQKGGRRFTCTNRHTEPGIYKYSIRVLDGTRAIELDPFIINM